jgi:class 3 adenylate cyclase
MAFTTRYARNGDVNLAYQVHGNGPPDLLVVSAFISHVEHVWENPGFARFLTRLAQFSRLIIWDRRGSGLSDGGPLGLEHEVGDVNAVLDAAGSTRAAVLAYNAGGPLAALHAARFPDRVAKLVLYGCLLLTVRDDDLPWVETGEQRERRVGELIEHWGQGANLDVLAPSAADDPQLRAWLARLERLAASPGQARRLVAAAGAVDVRPALASIASPTLVLHREDDQAFDVRHAREYARRIAGARLVELPGSDSLPSVGDTDTLLGEVEEFLTGRRRGGEQERALLTVLFTDMVGSTARAAELGDKRWRDLLAAHDTEVRRTLQRFDGEVIQRIGDGFLAVFDGAPSRAVRCARALREVVRAQGIALRIGLHTGECEILGDDVGGMAVHIAARVVSLAKSGEIIVSGTTYGTVVGAGLDFDYRGEHSLKGVPGRWPIFALNG